VKAELIESTRQACIGIAIFTIGLSKKLLLADLLGEYADLVFKGVRWRQILCSSWPGLVRYIYVSITLIFLLL
jgi:alginate O-acetyltransferase complex protein AlgI